MKQENTYVIQRDKHTCRGSKENMTRKETNQLVMVDSAVVVSRTFAGNISAVHRNTFMFYILLFSYELLEKNNSISYCITLFYQVRELITPFSPYTAVTSLEQH